LLMGDVYHGGLLRVFVENVGGEYQGVAFRFAAPNSLASGINHIIQLPGGRLLAAGIGGGACGLGGSGNWNWNGTCRALDLLPPTNTVPFEMLAVRSIAGGFEIEYTKAPNAAAGVAQTYNAAVPNEVALEGRYHVQGQEGRPAFPIKPVAN